MVKDIHLADPLCFSNRAMSFHCRALKANVNQGWNAQTNELGINIVTTCWYESSEGRLLASNAVIEVSRTQ